MENSGIISNPESAVSPNNFGKGKDIVALIDISKADVNEHQKTELNELLANYSDAVCATQRLVWNSERSRTLLYKYWRRNT